MFYLFYYFTYMEIFIVSFLLYKPWRPSWISIFVEKPLEIEPFFLFMIISALLKSGALIWYVTSPYRGNKWNFYFLGGLHENFGDGQSKRLPGHNFLSRSLFMVSNGRYLLLAVFGKHSISFLYLFSQCTQCKLKKKCKNVKKVHFFSIFYL